LRKRIGGSSAIFGQNARYDVSSQLSIAARNEASSNAAGRAGMLPGLLM
jgi:hypothetical protein